MKNKLIIVAGPTATGKSAAAVALSEAFRGSVISADSMQVYRGMDIGSAKITPEEMHGIPHYLIDCVSPHEEWNVVRFQQAAKQALSEIIAEGRLPVLCGGTGFYIQSVLYDIDFTEQEEDSAYREELLDFARANGNEALHAKLEKVDPEAAAAIHPNNVKRVIRALEFYRQSGEKISGHNETERAKEPAYDAAFFVLHRNREALYRAIDERVDRMFEAGLVAEVRRLQSEGRKETDVSMQGLGYRQVLRALDGRITMEEARAAVKQETRHFAKRQETWFKREKDTIPVDLDAFGCFNEAVAWMKETAAKRLGLGNGDL